MTVTACVPCYNNESTVGDSVRSLLEQSRASDVIEVLAIDDGSTDQTAVKAKLGGATVVSMGTNQGRGAVRARAIEIARGELLLSVDATAFLAPDFLEKALPWFDDPRMAAVFGGITQQRSRTAVDRWRGRHLYKDEDKGGVTEKLITWGILMRRSAILDAGNFDPSLRHSEDAELGNRVLAKGWKLAYEPSAIVTTMTSNTLGEVLERYWRWYGGVNPKFHFKDYARASWYSLRVLAVRDLRSRDLPGAAISLILPHYCAFRSLRGR